MGEEGLKLGGGLGVSCFAKRKSIFQQSSACGSVQDDFEIGTYSVAESRPQWR